MYIFGRKNTSICNLLNSFLFFLYSRVHNLSKWAYGLIFGGREGARSVWDLVSGMLNGFHIWGTYIQGGLYTGAY